VPFKSKKQKTYLAINEPDVYKKFKKEETMMYGKPMKKKDGGKLKNKIKDSYKLMDDDYKKRMKDPLKGIKVTKRPMGGKVYKVDNSGQDLVQKMYGGKIKK
jgi:hypothetical protein